MARRQRQRAHRCAERSRLTRREQHLLPADERRRGRQGRVAVDRREDARPLRCVKARSMGDRLHTRRHARHRAAHRTDGNGERIALRSPRRPWRAGSVSDRRSADEQRPLRRHARSSTIANSSPASPITLRSSGASAKRTAEAKIDSARPIQPSNAKPSRATSARSIPIDHPIVVHTFPNQYDKIYEPLLGFDAISGPSLQMGDPKKAHAETLKWIKRSREAKHPWFVCIDEIGPARYRRRARRRPECEGESQARPRGSVGQPARRRQRSRVVLRLQVPRQRSQLRRLPQPRERVEVHEGRDRLLPRTSAVRRDGIGRRSRSRRRRVLLRERRRGLRRVSAERREARRDGSAGRRLHDPLVRSPERRRTAIGRH